jgi:hypothetical protein
MRRKSHVGIERIDLPGGTVDLAPADIRRGVNDLALKVGQRHDVVVDHAERTDAGRGEIHQRRRAEAARADHQHGCFLQCGLAGAADLAQHDMAGVAFEFFGTQHGQVIPRLPSILMVRRASSRVPNHQVWLSFLETRLAAKLAQATYTCRRGRSSG